MPRLNSCWSGYRPPVSGCSTPASRRCLESSIPPRETRHRKSEALLALDLVQRHRRRAAKARAVGLDRSKRLTLPECRKAAHGELLVLTRAGYLPGKLLGLELAHHARRHAGDQRAAGHHETGAHETRSADECLLLHHCL